MGQEYGMGQQYVREDGTFCRNLREHCEGKAEADCNVSALPLLETFLASVKNSSIPASTSFCGLFMGT